MAKSNSTYHHADLRSALQQAGSRILKAEGLTALSLRRVAREVGVSATAPYRHFADKQSLLAAISEDGFHELQKRLESAGQNDPGDLDASGRAYLDFALEQPETYKLMFTHRVLCEGEENESLEEAGQAAFGTLVATIEDGIQGGLIGATDSAQLALGAWSLVHGISMLLVDGILGDKNFPSLTPEQALAICQHTFREGWRAHQNGEGT